MDGIARGLLIDNRLHVITLDANLLSVGHGLPRMINFSVPCIS